MLDHPRAVDILTTEHWSLLSTRTLGYQEMFGRTTIFVAILSGIVIALALLAQANQFGRAALLFALLLMSVALFVGLATFVRCVAINYEDARWIMGMTLLRQAYLKIAPELEPFFISGHEVRTDSPPLGHGTEQRFTTVARSLTTTSSVVAALNSVLAGAIASDVSGLFTASLAVDVVLGGFVSLVSAGLHVRYAARFRASHPVSRHAYSPASGNQRHSVPVMSGKVPGFTSRHVETKRGAIFIAQGGVGSPVLLLHGFPETHVMWRDIAPTLASSFLVICADLPGYGHSSCPSSDARHSPYSKRAMAQDLVEMMSVLGHDRFAVIGHDRGGRVAYRMAIDHPRVVSRLAALDVIPTGPLWDRADSRLTIGFWPFSLLAQPAPLPERLIAACPDAVIDDALGHWGSPGDVFPPDVRAAYTDALSDPIHVHAICEEYRAAATIDREHDQADASARHRIGVPLLVLWSETGGLNRWYQEEGGPLAIWRGLADDVRGGPVPGGHFFPEEDPARTARLLRDFLSA